ncbi:PAS domain S-box protein [Paludisphaera mucosa]|uniref:histidine kinase n=1 Tax=Paludisphaera mucosa TaxID=3030827 RepID=A0ABT6FD23_9BACT|nr:PAS domain S-box protein [Paludisphaera mucosa]MDG3005472.1 PAS domain S-box protein [Paludisphaera mucosa]
MTAAPRILIVEDSADDAEVMMHELSRGEIAPVWMRVESAGEMGAALATAPWDVVLSDYSLPGFGAVEALALCREADPDLPFVVVSGTIGEQRAVEMMRAGAADYLLKGNLVRLSATIDREVREVENRRARRRAERAASLLASVVESSGDAILSKSIDGLITSWNPAAERLYGWTAAEAVGRHISLIVPPEGREEASQIMDRLQKGERLEHFETVRLRKDGTRVEVAVTGSHLRDLDGRPLGYSWIAQDVTARKAAEAAMRASEARFRAVVDSGMLATFFWEEGGRVYDANDAFLKLVGYTRDEMRAGLLSWVEMSPPEARDGDLNALAEIAMTGRCVPYEKEYIRKDGGRVPILLGAAGLDGAARGVAFAIDQTVRKRAEERQARDAQILAGVRDSVVVTDSDGLVTYWNDGATRLYGWTAGELVGRSVLDRVPEGPPRESARDRLRAVGLQGEFQGEYEDYRKDGSRIWVEYRSSLIADGGLESMSHLGVAREITTRKDAETALQASESRYRTLIAATTAIVWNTPASGEIETEQAWGDFTGQAFAEYRGWGWLDAVHADDREATAHAWSTAVAERTVYQVAHRLRRADGVYRQMNVRGVPIMDPGGGIREWVGIHTDVTDQQRAEADLRLRDRAIRAVGQGIVIADADRPDDPIIYVSPGFERLTGYDSEEVLGRNCRFLQGEDTDPAAVDRLREAIRGGEPCTVELLNYRKDGSSFWNELSISPVRDAAGRLIHFVGVSVEVTTRRVLEERFRRATQRLEHVVASSPAILFTSSVAGDRIQEFTWISESLLEVLGYRPDAAMRPGWWAENIHPEDRGRILADLHGELFLRGRNDQEYRFRHGDGGYRWMRADLRLVRDATGRPLEVVGSWADVTERKSLEEQFQQAQKMDAFGQLAAGVAHDFNNLLTIINGYSDLLLQSLPQGDPSRNLVAEIYKAGERSAGLTRQLLAFSRQQVLATRVIDLNEVVTDTEKMLRRLIGEDVRLTAALGSEPRPVRADPGQVEQVLLNLAVNARDAMPEGGRLTIETRNVELDEAYVRTHGAARAGPHVLLSVADTGSGIPPELMAKVFEPFFTTKEPGKGTGLGLATVYGIVKQSGGHVAVYSEVGVGTTFKVYLPRVEPASTGPKSPSPILPPPPGTETVLLAEDEAAVRSLTRYVLAQCGYRVLEASDGDDAVRVAAGYDGPIDLLVTDVVMPGSGGRAVAERMAERRPGIRVLYVSGYTDDAVIRHGVLREGADFLQKPFTPIALAFKVRAVLDRDGAEGARSVGGDGG